MLAEVFRWTVMKQDTEEFLPHCLLCVMCRGGEEVLRPLWCLTLHGTHPNDVLHFDYLFFGESMLSKKYVLVFKDNLSEYAWLASSKNANAPYAAKILAFWICTVIVRIRILDSYVRHSTQALGFQSGLPFREQAFYGDGSDLKHQTRSHCRILAIVKWNCRKSQPWRSPSAQGLDCGIKACTEGLDSSVWRHAVSTEWRYLAWEEWWTNEDTFASNDWAHT